MIMTDKFSFQRMGTLMTKYLNDNKKSLILKLLVMYGTLIVMTLFAGWNNMYFYRQTSPGHDVTWIHLFPMLVMLVLAFGCLAASVMFEDLKSKESRISMLMTPATTLEKYLSRWILYIVGFPILFIIGFYLADAVRCVVFRILIPDNTSIALFNINSYFDKINMPERFHPILFCVFILLSIQSFFVLGSVVWQPLSFFKTFGSLFILMQVYVLSSIWLTDSLMEPGMFYGMEKSDDNLTLVILGFYSFMILTCLINWTLAYFRLKEAEIIKRW